MRANEELINKMEEIIEKLGPSQSRQISQKVKGYRNDIKNMRKELQKTENYNQFMTDTPSNMEIRQQEQRVQILEDSHLLNETSNSIKRSYGMTLETREIGINTMGELHRQRNVLEKVDEDVKKKTF